MIAIRRRSLRGLRAGAFAAAVVVLLVGGTAATRTDPAPTVTDLAPTRPLVQVVVEGDGQVSTTEPGLSCRSTCSRRIDAGTAVTLTAAPEEGFVARWGGACAGTEGDTCTLSADADTTIEVEFVRADTETSEPPPPTTTGPTPRPPPPHPVTGRVRPVVLDEVDKVLADLSSASVAFNTPETMGLGESAEIELLLSVQHSIDQLKKQIREAGSREGARVRITDEMEARLTGLGFQIEAITPERQAVSKRDVTRWQWQVQPTRTGVRRLHLTLTGFVHVEGQRTPRTIRTFQRTLTIRVTWQDRVVGFFGDNWQWLWTAVLVPVVIWLLRSRQKQRAEPTSKAPPPVPPAVG